MSESLKSSIDAVISSDGHITVDDFMELCLFHPTDGYYNKDQQFGRNGDFITAPEISQLFGEILGAWAVNRWMEMGSPSRFNLIELGPGRGTMMADMLRVAQKIPEFISGANIILVERGKKLKYLQAKFLSQYNITHIAHISEVEHGDVPSIIIANEFFDAFPIKQFQQEDGEWRERVIIYSNDELGWSTIPSKSAPKFQEISPASDEYMRDIAVLLGTNGGCFLFIDYGYIDGSGLSLQALSNHGYSDVLQNKGCADLTSHVNFTQLIDVAKDAGLQATPVTSQAQFLSENGIVERARALIKQNPAHAARIESELLRLLHPQQMGSIFKVAVVYKNDKE